MPFDNLLGDFLDAAFQSLTDKCKQENSNYDSVKLVVDNVNGDVFTFLFYNAEDNFRWERQIWYKQNDIAKISNPIEGLKYIGQKIIPSIIEQQGVTKLQELKEIFISVKSLLGLDSNEKSNRIVIDGTEYLLQIKLTGIQKEFKWKTIPYGWSDVEIISNKIIELSNKIY